MSPDSHAQLERIKWSETAAPPPPGDPEAPFFWARALMPAVCQLPSVSQVWSRVEALGKRPGVTLWRGSEKDRLIEALPVKQLESVVNMPPFVTVGTGPIRIAVVASPHADEPVGVMSALTLLEGFFSEAAAPWRDRVRLAVVPMAYPNGYDANAPWMSYANALEALEPRRAFKMRMMPVKKIRAMQEPREGNLELASAVENYLTQWLTKRRRAAPGEDREFGYGPPDSDPLDPHVAFHPECRSIAAFLSDTARAWGGFDAMIALHSMGAAAGHLTLLRTTKDEPLAPWELTMRSIARASALTGLGLHAEDRGGEKGFARLAPGFQSTPTLAAMTRDLRLEDGAPFTMMSPSMEWIDQRANQVMVTEAPAFLCRALNDGSESRVSRGELTIALARERRDAADRLDGSGAAKEMSAYWRHLASIAEAMTESEEGASKGQVARSAFERAVVRAMAWGLGSRELGAGSVGPIHEASENPVPEIVDEFLGSLDVRPVGLFHQSLLQVATILSAAG